MDIPVTLLRMLILMAPAVLLTYHFVHKQHELVRWVGALFAGIWQLQWRLILLAAGIQLGLWQFPGDNVQLYGVPIDIVFGSSLLLGVLPCILAPAGYPRRKDLRSKSQTTILRRVILACWLGLLVATDIFILTQLFMLPYTNSALPFLLLYSSIAIIPAQLLARWTEHNTHLYARSVLQNVAWAMLLLWLFPALIFELTDDNWKPLLRRNWYVNLLYLIPLLLPGVLILNALYEFARRGRGTAFPYDAPKYLVTSGVYRYLSNPMQVGIVLLMSCWGLMLDSYYVMLSAGVALVLFVVFKNVCNGSCRIGLTDPAWRDYQASVPRWFPWRWADGRISDALLALVCRLLPTTK